jgi:hypothetical protein
MPPKKKPKVPKELKKVAPKKSKESHVQSVKVSMRVRDGGGGRWGTAPTMYVTYASTPPANQCMQFIFDYGMPSAPFKREHELRRSTMLTQCEFHAKEIRRTINGIRSDANIVRSA